MKTGIKIILFGIMLFSCMREYKENPEEERKKAQKVYDFFRKEYNLILAGDIEKNYEKGSNNTFEIYTGEAEAEIVILKKPVEYRSKYFKDEVLPVFDSYSLPIEENREIMIFTDYDNRIIRKEIPFFKKPNYDLFFHIIDYYGLRFYVLNKLIYDKSQGNDFEQIEKILDKYSTPDIEILSATYDEGWECGNLDKRSKHEWIPFMYVQDEKCVISKDSYENKYDIYSIERIKKYGEKFEKYFSKERKFEEIDWKEFLEYNNITPIINFYIYRNTTDRRLIKKEEAQKLLMEMSPYYNKKTYLIILHTEDENEKGSYVW